MYHSAPTLPWNTQMNDSFLILKTYHMYFPNVKRRISYFSRGLLTSLKILFKFAGLSASESHLIVPGPSDQYLAPIK